MLVLHGKVRENAEKKRKQELRKEITVAEKEFVGERSQRTVCLLQEKR